MKIHLNRTYGKIVIILGVLILCLFLAFTFGGGTTDVFFGLSGLMCIGFGIIFLKNTYFEVTPNSLIVKALIGSAHTTYPFNSTKDFSTDGKSVFLVINGNREKLPIYSWVADKKDWEIFIQWLRADNRTS